MKTETQYLEPVGFKGSKGKWFVEEKQKHLFPSVILGEHPKASFYKRPRIIVNETDSAKEGSFEATAQLIAQSKELAKALQECVNELKLLKKTVKSELIKDEYIQPTIDNAEQVLKDAGLSDK